MAVVSAISDDSGGAASNICNFGSSSSPAWQPCHISDINVAVTSLAHIASTAVDALTTAEGINAGFCAESKYDTKLPYPVTSSRRGASINPIIPPMSPRAERRLRAAAV